MKTIRPTHISIGTRTSLLVVLLAAVLSLLPFGSVHATEPGATPGTIVAWGYDASAQVRNTPKDPGYIAIAAGLYHSLALGEDGTIVVWGYDDEGQVSSRPTDKGYTAIAAGFEHSLALQQDGTIVAWGSDNHGQVSQTPTDKGYIAIAAGYDHSLALRQDGTIVAWGSDFSGEVSNTPKDPGYTAIAAGRYHNLALREDGTIVAWGYDFYGQVSSRPTDKGYTAIAAGDFHNLALQQDGSIVAWGWDDEGQVSQSPTGAGYTAIAAGFEHSLARRQDGSIVAWGDDKWGQVSSRPTDKDYTAIAAGGFHNLALAVDTTPPAITASATTADGTYSAGSWTNQTVTVSFGCTDALSGVASCPSDQLFSSEGSFSAQGTATDKAGNTASASFGPIQIDKSAPSISCGAADGAWHASDANVACTASDTVSGLANAADATFNLSTSVASGTETSNAATNSRSVADKAGNSVIAGPISGNQIDKKAPSISISTPGSAAYLLGQVVAANYSCSDGGAGLASCAGTTATGANLDTTSVGPKTFTVTAADNVGNISSTTVNYSVSYNWSGFFQPIDNLPTLNSVKAGLAVPVKFSLGGNYGLNIFAQGYPKAQQVTCSGGAPIDEIEQTATAGASGLQYDAASGQYTYTWKTEKSWTGTCRQLVVRLSDGTEHTASFKFK